MGKSKAVTYPGDIISKEDIIKTVQQRFEKVKAEKAKRIKEWKESLTDLTNDAKNKKKNILKRLII